MALLTGTPRSFGNCGWSDSQSTFGPQRRPRSKTCLWTGQFYLPTRFLHASIVGLTPSLPRHRALSRMYLEGVAKRYPTSPAVHMRLLFKERVHVAPPAPVVCKLRPGQASASAHVVVLQLHRLLANCRRNLSALAGIVGYSVPTHRNVVDRVRSRGETPNSVSKCGHTRRRNLPC